MTNEQIDRGIKKSNDILKGTHNIRVKRRMADINEVLEAMKEPEEDGECKYCYNLKPGKWIPVDSIKKPRCSACGKKLYQDKPDPIREVYEKWKEHYPENWVGCCGMTPYAETGMFANDMWNAIKQHCEEK